MKLLTPILTGLLLVSFAIPTIAKQDKKPPEHTPRLQQKFSVDFGGGTVEELIEDVRLAYEDSLNGSSELESWNIVLTEDSKAFRLPRIEVTTNLKGILSLLDALAGDDYSVSIEHLGDDEEILLIDISSVEDSEVSVVNAKQLLEAIPEDTFLSAIKSGLEMSGGTSRVELKLHQETGLLFVKGIGRELTLVDNIVDQLNSGQGLSRGGGPGMGMMGGGGGMGMMGGGPGMGMGAGGMGMGGGDDEGSRGGGMGGKFGGGMGSGIGGMGMGPGAAKKKPKK